MSGTKTQNHDKPIKEKRNINNKNNKSNMSISKVKKVSNNNSSNSKKKVVFKSSEEDGSSKITIGHKSIENSEYQLILEEGKKFDHHQEFLDILEFKSQQSINIETKHLEYCISHLKRSPIIVKIMDYVPADIAVKLERSILEFTLITTTLNKLSEQMINHIYFDKVNDICVNLDTNNKRINNQTLKPALLKGHIDPNFVAFMKPEQIHPAAWKDQLAKAHAREMRNSNKKVTDIYKCFKCGESKSTTTQMQTRSADEPMTIFVTCVVCYNTFTK